MRHVKIAKDKLADIQSILQKVADGQLVPVEEAKTASDHEIPQQVKTAAAELSDQLVSNQLVSASKKAEVTERLTTADGSLAYLKRATDLYVSERSKTAALEKEIQELKEKLAAPRFPSLGRGEGDSHTVEGGSSLKAAGDKFAASLGVGS